MSEIGGTRDWHAFINPLGIVRLVLLVDWDPIGVFGYAGAMDEYDDYAPEVLALLQTGPTAQQVAEHLRQVEARQMGTGGSPESQERRLATAQKLLTGFASAMDSLLM